MSQNRSSVEAVVQSYFDGLYEGDAEKLGAIFHPSADLRWVEKGELQVLTVPDWLDRVRKRPPARPKASRARISSSRLTVRTTRPPSSRSDANCRRVFSRTIWWL